MGFLNQSNIGIINIIDLYPSFEQNSSNLFCIQIFTDAYVPTYKYTSISKFNMFLSASTLLSETSYLLSLDLKNNWPQIFRSPPISSPNHEIGDAYYHASFLWVLGTILMSMCLHSKHRVWATRLFLRKYDSMTLRMTFSF